MPEIEKFYQQYQDQAHLLTISYDSEEQIEAMVKDKQLSFPILADQEGKVFASYGIRGIPYTVVIDSDGNIIKKLPGPVTSQELAKYIK